MSEITKQMTGLIFSLKVSYPLGIGEMGFMIYAAASHQGVMSSILTWS